jgi:calcineurin-like phosphoesterase family protein
MSVQWFIGDTHYGHNGISQKFRTHFVSDEEHNETIHQNIMGVSGKRDTLFILGDICFKTDQFWRIEEYSKNFEKVFLCGGNHDHASLFRYASQFDNVYTFGIIKKFSFWLSHAPVHPQELYRGMNVHGHVHSNTVPDARYYNVSCENINYQPVSLQHIRSVFEDRVNQGLIVPLKEHKD